ncbi:hypothetical protein MGWOODY_Smn864 [hydrothermal vent metagenome]|uniref:Uncharacterized protein n=1 Tax=hydrothermal vent metagenome TaxID=652676 RepID=A0A160TP91_9ZZZZ
MSVIGGWVGLRIVAEAGGPESRSGKVEQTHASNWGAGTACLLIWFTMGVL